MKKPSFVIVVLFMVILKCNGLLPILDNILSSAHNQVHSKIHNVANTVLSGINLNHEASFQVHHGRPNLGPPRPSGETVVVVVEEDKFPRPQSPYQNGYRPHQNNGIPNQGIPDQVIVIQERPNQGKPNQGLHNQEIHYQGGIPNQSGSNEFISQNQYNSQFQFSSQNTFNSSYMYQEKYQGGNQAASKPTQGILHEDRPPYSPLNQGGHGSQYSGSDGQNPSFASDNNNGFKSHEHNFKKPTHRENNNLQPQLEAIFGTNPNLGGHDGNQQNSESHSSQSTQDQNFNNGNYNRPNNDFNKPPKFNNPNREDIPHNFSNKRITTTKPDNDDIPLFVPLSPNEYEYGGDKINIAAPKRHANDNIQKEEDNSGEYPIDIRFQDN